MLPPLAERMRPKTLQEYAGQHHLTGEDAPLRKLIERENISSSIFWGPPGTGKTTLANIIAHTLNRKFFALSAINSGVKDIREVLEKARQLIDAGENAPLLFIDEVHRFSKSQQDSLLGAVENGTVVLIGATTENPSFEVISPLLSRMQVYLIKELSEDDLLFILQRAMKSDEVLRNYQIKLKETDALMKLSGGDARKLLNVFEIVVNTLSDEKEIEITNEKVQQIIQKKLALYDKGGEQHYDIISAFIKSIRGSDPNAAVYYLARMIKGGEDPLFIARRMLILASEDIGNANANALLLANACFDAVSKIGYPECRIILSHTVIYLATSAKSNASYVAIENAISKVDNTGDLPVPLHLRNAPTKLMKEIGYGKNYQYAHEYEQNFIDLEYLPDAISGEKFYEPGPNQRENEIRNFLKARWKEKYGY